MWHANTGAVEMVMLAGPYVTVRANITAFEVPSPVSIKNLKAVPGIQNFITILPLLS